MSPKVVQVNKHYGGFPRPRGDEPRVIREFDTLTEFSPPTRG